MSDGNIPVNKLEELIEQLDEKEWSRWSHPRDGFDVTKAELEELIDEYAIDNTQDVSDDALDGPILDGQEVSKGYRRNRES